MALTETQIADLKSKHGDALVAFETPKGTMVFKKPSRIVWADFIASVSKDKSDRAQAFRRVALACVVMPSVEDATAIFEDYPVLPSKVTDKLSDLAGGDEGTFEVKKL